MAARVHFEGATAVTPATTPAGLDTQVQFNDAGSFGASAGLTFNKTNGELVINQLANSKGLSIYGNGANAGSYFKASVDNFGQPIISTNGTTRFNNTGSFLLTAGGYARFTSSGFLVVSSYSTFGTTTNLGARVNIKGTGATAATTALLVQNSAGTDLFKVFDSGVSVFNSTIAVASAQLEVVSTTKGFLPPRMTSVQLAAIAAPAAGLQVYDTTTNNLNYFNGTVWVVL